MRSSRLVFLCLIAPLLASPPRVSGDEPRKITLRGKEFSEFPPAKLREKGIDVPDIPDDRNAAFVYIQAYNARKDLPPDLQPAFDLAIAGTWPAGDEGPRLAQWLDDNGEALDLARRAAAMPDCRMPSFGSQDEPLFQILLPTLSEHRQLARMFAADAARRQAGQQSAAAIDDAMVIERMASHSASGWTLIEHLVGDACRELGSRTLVRAAAAPDVDAATLDAARRDLETLTRHYPSWERAIRSEQASAMSAMDDLFRSPGIPTVFPIAFTRDDGWGRLGRRLAKLFYPERACKRNIRSFYDQIVNGLRPAADGRPAQYLADDEKLLQQVPAWDVLTKALVPSLGRTFETDVRVTSNSQRARLTLAVEAFARRTGRRPASLRELVPQYVPSIPIDPTTGHPFELSSDGAPDSGLALMTRTASAKPQAPHSAPPTAESPAPASEWRRYVDRFIREHRLDPSQQAAARAVLTELEHRIEPGQRNSADRVARLRQRLARTSGDEERRALSRELETINKPVDDAFAELKHRLDALLTRAQRDSASRPRPADRQP